MNFGRCKQEPGGWNRVILQVADLPARTETLKKAGLHFRNQMEVHARDNVTIMRFLDTAALSATRDPTIPNSSSAISLKHQFHTKLDDTRIAGTRMCSHDRPESSSSNPRVGIIKIHLIENVEKLGAKLRIDAFLDFETLKKSHVKASERWTIVGSGPDLTE